MDNLNKMLREIDAKEFARWPRKWRNELLYILEAKEISCDRYRLMVEFILERLIKKDTYEYLKRRADRRRSRAGRSDNTVRPSESGSKAATGRRRRPGHS